MSKLGPFPKRDREAFEHPLLRFIDEAKDAQLTIEVVRSDDELGFKSAKLYLHVIKDGIEQPPMPYTWEDDLNDGLIERRIKAVSLDNEKVRFGLDFRRRFRRAVLRYGDGFFNSVLILKVRELKFGDFEEVQSLLKHIRTNPPYSGSKAKELCGEDIAQTLGEVAEDMKKLGYSDDEVESLLVGSIAKYLNDRFMVSDRIRMGWA